MCTLFFLSALLCLILVQELAAFQGTFARLLEIVSHSNSLCTPVCWTIDTTKPLSEYSRVLTCCFEQVQQNLPVDSANPTPC
jgi:hypothetical protein